MDAVRAHERYLIETVPFTPEELVRVRKLFNDECQAIHERDAGAEIPLAQIRTAIAQERIEISRTARKRIMEEVCTCDNCESQRDPAWKHRPEAMCDCHQCLNNASVPE